MPEVVQHDEADLERRQVIREAFKAGIDFPVGAKSFTHNSRRALMMAYFPVVVIMGSLTLMDMTQADSLKYGASSLKVLFQLGMMVWTRMEVLQVRR